MISNAPYVLEFPLLHYISYFDMYSPTVKENSFIPIVVKTSDPDAADRYFSYNDFIKSSYVDLLSLCRDIDCTEWEKGKIYSDFYPVAHGSIDGMKVKMIYTKYK